MQDTVIAVKCPKCGLVYPVNSKEEIYTRCPECNEIQDTELFCKPITMDKFIFDALKTNNYSKGG